MFILGFSGCGDSSSDSSVAPAVDKLTVKSVELK